jgi:hypothetical protein
VRTGQLPGPGGHLHHHRTVPAELIQVDRNDVDAIKIQDTVE